MVAGTFSLRNLYRKIRVFSTLDSRTYSEFEQMVHHFQKKDAELVLEFNLAMPNPGSTLSGQGICLRPPVLRKNFQGCLQLQKDKNGKHRTFTIISESRKHIVLLNFFKKLCNTKSAICMTYHGKVVFPTVQI